MFEGLLDWLQGRNDKAFEKEGLTDKTLESQIRINRLRNRLNITDERTVIKDNEGFVQ